MTTYNVALKEGVDYDAFWNEIETDGSGSTYVPQRGVDIVYERPNSLRQCWYDLTDEEAVKLQNDPRVFFVEIPPEFRKYYYKIIISSSLVESVLATNTNEVSELFNLSLLIWMALFVILPCILIIWVMKCNLPKISKKVYFSILIIAISSALIIRPYKSY